MARRGRLLILLGLILALATAGLAFFMLRGAGPAAVEQPKTIQVVIAARDIEQREDITEDALKVQDWPVDSAPQDAIRFPALAIGKMAQVPIFKGQIVLSGMVISREEAMEAGKASMGVPEGKVAFAFPIGDQNSVAGAINEGDYVDILANVRFQAVSAVPAAETGGEGAVAAERAMSTQLTLQDVQVLKVGPWNPPAPTAEGQAPAPVQNYLTLLINQQDALVLQYLRDNPNISIDFVLRGIGDHNIIGTESVTLDYILARFKISLPGVPPIIGP